jgi:hypothetical protein
MHVVLVMRYLFGSPMDGDDVCRPIVRDIAKEVLKKSLSFNW